MLSGEVATEIDGMRRALGAGALGRIAPHITLVPPKNVAGWRLEEAFDLVGAAAVASPPIRVTIGPPRTFFPRAPVVYLEVSGDLDEIAALRSKLATGVLASPASRPSRTFVPHVTLDQKVEPSRIPSVLTALESYRAATTIEEVTLLAFDEAGRRWHPVRQARFEEPFVAGRGGLEIELVFSRVADPVTAGWARYHWQRYSEAAYGGGFVPDEPWVLTARVGGELVGVAEGEVRGRVCRIARLIVAPGWRSMGVGTQLLRGAERNAAKKCCDRMRLETMRGGRSEALYRASGYEVVADLPSHREGRDFVVMEKRLA